jgi:2-C-methyl-D-erythritol 4-phosphate cytidylyltransferase
MADQLSAVVVAAGRSQRMGFDKLLTPLVGKPLILHTLSRLQSSPHVREIVLVVRDDTKDEVAAIIAPLQENGSIRLVPGGEKRQDSVQAGLNAVLPDSNYVLIHDAARPCVTHEVVDLV